MGRIYAKTTAVENTQTWSKMWDQGSGWADGFTGDRKEYIQTNKQKKHQKRRLRVNRVKDRKEPGTVG